MPSVTQILDTFPETDLIEWKLRVGKVKAEQIGTEAKRIGRLVETRIQEQLKHLPLTTLQMDEAILSCLDGWEKFLHEYPWFPGKIQQMQRELQREEIVGHPDFELPYPVDLKCATAIRPTYWTQVAAYSWLQNADQLPERLGILRLDKVRHDYEYQELVTEEEIAYERQVWQDYRHLYQHRERVKQRAIQMKEQEAGIDVV